MFNNEKIMERKKYQIGFVESVVNEANQAFSFKCLTSQLIDFPAQLSDIG